MRLGRLPPFNNNNNITASSYLPGTTSFFYQRMLTTILTSSWGTKVGREAPELQTGSGFRVLSCVFSPVLPPLVIARCRIPGRRVFFPVSVQSTYPAMSGRTAQPSTSASSHLVLLLAQLFGGKDEHIFLVTGFTLSCYQVSLLDFPYYILAMLLHSFHKNQYDFPEILLFFCIF